MSANKTTKKKTKEVIPKRDSKGLSIASLVLGIIAFLIGALPFIGWTCAILAMTFGIIVLVREHKGEHVKGKGMAIAGLVLGSVGFIIAMFVLMALPFIILAFSGMFV